MIVKLENGYTFHKGRIAAYVGKGMAYLRLTNGLGIHIKDVRQHRLLFSERNGYQKRLQIGPYSIKALRAGR